MTPRVLRSSFVLVVSVFLVSHIFPGGLPQRSALSSAPVTSLVAHYSQPAAPERDFLLSSAAPPTIGDVNGFLWDDFTLAQGATITRISWLGAYERASSSRTSRVWQFIVSIYPSDARGAAPDLGAAVARHEQRGEAGESAGAVEGALQAYAYGVDLREPVRLEAGQRYWLGIQAIQYAGAPSWGWLRGSGNGAHLRRMTGAPGVFEERTGDAAFVLSGP